MAVTDEIIEKIEALPEEKYTIVVNLINQLSATEPIDIFEELRKNGSENPMTEDEVDSFVADVRRERNAVSC